MRLIQRIIVNSLWATIAIFISGSCAMEKNIGSGSDSDEEKKATSFQIGLPMELEDSDMDSSSGAGMRKVATSHDTFDLRIPFDCFHKSPIKTSMQLVEDYSVLIRTTIRGIFKFVSSSNFENDFVHFMNLQKDVNTCFNICQKWDHVALPLFSKLKKLCQTKSLKKKDNIKSIITQKADNFWKTLKKVEVPDSAELQLIRLHIVGYKTVEEVLALARILARLKAQEVAIHYLLQFGVQVQFQYSLGAAEKGVIDPDTAAFYGEAAQLGSKEAKIRIAQIQKEVENLDDITRFTPAVQQAMAEEGIVRSFLSKPEQKEDVSTSLSKAESESSYSRKIHPFSKERSTSSTAS